MRRPPKKCDVGTDLGTSSICCPSSPVVFSREDKDPGRLAVTFAIDKPVPRLNKPNPGLDPVLVGVVPGTFLPLSPGLPV